MNTSHKLQEELLELLEFKEQEFKYNKKSSMFPDEGPYRRDLYAAHIKFINASIDHSQLAFIAANRTGKTRAGAYIMSCHLTGDYPAWWTGRKYINAVNAWAAGKTNQKTKEIVQEELLGPVNEIGSGMIPKESIIGAPVMKNGVPGGVETIRVRHKSGGTSVLTFKSYEQGRGGFEGTKQQVIWLDEEPEDAKIYSECLIRTTDEFRPGIIYCTFTPLYGISEITKKFLPTRRCNKDGSVAGNSDLFAIQTTWDDVPHLSESEKKRLWDGCSPHEREARSRGIPSLGSGAVYPYLEEDITCGAFQIPEWWPRAYGLDPGWKRTAAIWGAKDPDTGIIYLYSEHYLGETLPPIHASAIKQRGSWIEGASDPAGANISDGTRIFDLYVDHGLLLTKADKRNKESGIAKVNEMFASGQLIIFNTLKNTLDEFGSYCRDEDGKIKDKQADHLMDAMQYLLTTGLNLFSLPPDPDKQQHYEQGARDEYTGY